MNIRKKTILFGALLVFFCVWQSGYAEDPGQGEHPEKTGHEPHEEDIVRLSDAQIQEFGIELAVAGPGTLAV